MESTLLATSCTIRGWALHGGWNQVAGTPQEGHITVNSTFHLELQPTILRCHPLQQHYLKLHPEPPNSNKIQKTWVFRKGGRRTELCHIPLETATCTYPLSRIWACLNSYASKQQAPNPVITLACRGYPTAKHKWQYVRCIYVTGSLARVFHNSKVIGLKPLPLGSWASCYNALVRVVANSTL